MLLLTNIGQLLTLRGPAAVRRGAAMRELGIVADAAVLCSGTKIIAVGPRREIARQAKRAREIDCGRRVALPGFVDSHTHPVFAAPRLVDFEQRIAGATYEQIAEKGGGIRSSVDAVRSALRRSLAEQVVSAVTRMNQHGTTTVEAKSGYGLDAASEIKSLEAIRAAAARFAGTIVPTLLGAHVVPREFSTRREEYVRLVIEEMIPRAARKTDAAKAPGSSTVRPVMRASSRRSASDGQGAPRWRSSGGSSRLAEFVDVFCERGAFTVAETRLIFEAARRHGLGVRAHLCQLSETAVADLLEFEPASLDHMECACPADLPLLAQSSTVITLLPGADYFLGLLSYAPARRFIEAGVALALATDFNPGTSPTISMPMVLSLACTQLQMSPAEAIAAATINGAAALRLAHSKGSIEPGKDADVAVFDVRDHREICYWFGENRCWAVINRGVLQTRR
ncbi:MAG TPA: imidazolonepropionase [Terriglobales bacterium]|nr:imidazolonepropionase [Terriglobales bacterium]